jgi:hypothetical protein
MVAGVIFCHPNQILSGLQAVPSGAAADGQPRNAVDGATRLANSDARTSAIGESQVETGATRVRAD